MKFLGKFFLTLLLLIVFSFVVIYVMLQTQWGAGWLSRWISDKTAWHLSISKIEHNFSSPSHIILDDFSFGHDGQPAVIVVAKVDLGLSLVQFSDPLHFASIGLSDGTANLANLTDDTTLPMQADRLQLHNMRIDSPAHRQAFSSVAVNGGITPWQPGQHDLLGHDTQFRLSAKRLELNKVVGENVLIEGSVDKGNLQLTNVGADIARGSMTGSASRDAAGNWDINQLRLNDIRYQSADNLHDFLQQFLGGPSIAINRLDMTDARLQGPDWAVTDLDLTLKNLTWNNGDWQSEDGSLVLNAGNFINGSLTLNDPIIAADFSTQGIALKQFSSRWVNGVVRADGNWTRSDKRLTLNNLAVAGLEYTLPQDWRDKWQAALPEWLESVLVQRAQFNHNLVIDINPAWPFQMTSLDGNASNLLLAKQQQWGIWEGQASFNAAEATFNRTDLRHPSLTLAANESGIQITEMSAFNNKGLLEGTANIGQQPERPLSLSLKGRGVPVNVLQNWGWPQIALEGDSNLQLELKASLAAASPLRPSVNATLNIQTDSQSQQQTLHAGQLP
ncbi:AsmA family protein [Pantoea sp. A4]|uniref:AsmA family protein n=1 Tax=Pantoea sp. A4 TaxID=1225184 RepID=UPI0004744E1A|nr:AsmA family protein [Pantoea sp. A4]